MTHLHPGFSGFPPARRDPPRLEQTSDSRVNLHPPEEPRLTWRKSFCRLKHQSRRHRALSWRRRRKSTSRPLPSTALINTQSFLSSINVNLKPSESPICLPKTHFTSHRTWCDDITFYSTLSEVEVCVFTETWRGNVRSGVSLCVR